MWFGAWLGGLFAGTILSPWTQGYYDGYGQTNYDARPQVKVQTDYETVSSVEYLQEKLNRLNRNLDLNREQWIPDFDPQNQHRVRFVLLQNYN